MLQNRALRFTDECKPCCRDLLERLGGLEVGARDDALKVMLGQLSKLSALDLQFVASLRSTAFVPTPSGHLSAPESLYDPRCPPKSGPAHSRAR